MGGKFLISMALYLKVFINKVTSCAFEKAINVADNKSNFNSNLED